MRISDWSSDVCSSDLADAAPKVGAAESALVLAVRQVSQLDQDRRHVRRLEHGESREAMRVAENPDLALQFVDQHAREDRRIVHRLALAQRDQEGCDRIRLVGQIDPGRSEEHTSELQSLMRISYAVFCLKKKTKKTT